MITETFEERWERLKERTSVDGWKGSDSFKVTQETWDIAGAIVDRFTLSHCLPFVSCGSFGSICLSYESFTIEIDPVIV